MSRPGNFPYTNPYTASTQRQLTQNAFLSTDSSNKLIHADVRIHDHNGTTTTSVTSNQMSSSTTTTSIESIIQQLERSGSKNPPAQTVVPCLKHLLQIACTSTWNIGQIVRFSEWTLSVLSSNSNNCIRNGDDDVIGSSRQNQHDKHNHHPQPPVVCIFATITLSRLMEIHWDDSQIYAAIMTCNDEQNTESKHTKINWNNPNNAHHKKRNKALLDILNKTVITCGYDHGVSCSSSLLQTSITALGTAWQALHRLNIITSSSNDTGRLYESAWWISQDANNNYQSETDSPTTDRIENLTCIVLKGLIMDAEEWESTASKLSSNGYSTLQPTIHKHDWNTLQKQLQNEVIRLNDSNMPVSSFTTWSLTCFQLLTIMNSMTVNPHFVIPNNHNDTDNTMLDLEFNLADEYKRILQSSDILDHIVRATFYMPGINLADDSPRPKPRWTQQSDTATIQTCFVVLETLYRTSPVMIGNHIAHHPMARHFLTMTWSTLIFQKQQSPGATETTTSSRNADRLSQLQFLHRHCRSITRETLKNVIRQQKQQPTQNDVNNTNSTNYGAEENSNLVDTCRKLLFNLLERISRQPRHASGVSSAALLKELLEDGLVLVLDDEISRALWISIDHRFIEQCVESLSSFAALVTQDASSSVSDYYRPILPILLDLVYLFSQKTTSYSDDGQVLCPYKNELISSLSSQTVNQIIALMCPKGSSDKKTNDNNEDEANGSMLSILEESYRSSNSEDSTPPAPNLTRNENIDYDHENSACRLGEAEHTISHGMEPTIRLAAAALLAALGTSFKTGNNIPNKLKGANVSLQGRMIDAVISFISECQFSFCRTGEIGIISLDMTRRRIKLISILGTIENAENLSGLIFVSEVSQMKYANAQARYIGRYKAELREFRSRENRLLSETEELSKMLSAKSLCFQREKNIIQQATAQNAKQLIEVHVSERLKAEKRAQDLAKHMAESERLLGNAERIAKECREAEAFARESLEQTTAQLEQISSREKELVQRKEKSEAELFRVKEELISTKNLVRDVQNREQHMQDKIDVQASSLHQAEETEQRLKEGLENLFADMCSLAYLYEIKERESLDYQETGEVVVEKLKRKLETERQRNCEMEERQKRIQYENDMLSKKYAKMREKLDDEREDRRKENERRKRAAPVSYINQLHLNQSSVGTESQRMKSSLKPASRSDTGKENASISSLGSSSNSRAKSNNSRGRY